MFVVGPTRLCGPLYRKDQVPEHFHESFIDKGYRSPKSSPFQCVLSLFAATNETLNFWTHFLPSWYFMWVLRGLSDTLDFRHDSYTWPVLAYMCMCWVFPLASSIAHTFNTMSDKARHICFFLDYSSISISALSAAIVMRAYCFPSELRFTVVGDLYIPMAGLNAILCIVFSCKTRFMKPSTFRKFLRLFALGYPCVFSTLPLTYRLICGTDAETRLASWYPHFFGIFMMYVSAFLYGSHFPERLSPGSFDIVGHSHQLFHVCTILGAMGQLMGVLSDMQERKAELQPDWEFQPIMASLGLVGTVLLINTGVVIAYSCYLYRKHKVKAT